MDTAASAHIAGGDALLFTSLWIPSAMLLPIGAAALLHRYVEVPVQQWGRALAHRGDRYGVTTIGVKS